MSFEYTPEQMRDIEMAKAREVSHAMGRNVGFDLGFASGYRKGSHRWAMVALLLVVLWCTADVLQPATCPITAAMPLAWTAMLLARLWVVQRGWRSWRPGS
jgi:hypothetical protein